MIKRFIAKVTIPLVILTLVLAPLCVSAQTQQPAAGGAGATGAAAQGTTTTAAGAGAAGAGAAEGMSTAAIVGIVGGVALMGALVAAAVSNDETPAHTTAHH